MAHGSQGGSSNGQSDRVCGRARDDSRGAHRTGLPRQRARAGQFADRCAPRDAATRRRTAVRPGPGLPWSPRSSAAPNAPRRWCTLPEGEPGDPDVGGNTESHHPVDAAPLVTADDVTRPCRRSRRRSAPDGLMFDVARLDANRIAAWRGLQALVGQIERGIDEELRADWDIHLGWFDVLASLQRLGGRARPLDVSADLRLPPSSLSRRLDRSAGGGVDRPPSRRARRDHRAVEIELTRTGRRLWREMNVSYRRACRPSSRPSRRHRHRRRATGARRALRDHRFAG